MNDPMNPPASNRNNTTLIIIAVVAVVLLCCCCVLAITVPVLWQCGDLFAGLPAPGCPINP